MARNEIDHLMRQRTTSNGFCSYAWNGQMQTCIGVIYVKAHKERGKPESHGPDVFRVFTELR